MPKHRYLSHQDFLALSARARMADDPMLQSLIVAMEQTRDISRWVSQLIQGYGTAILRGNLGRFDHDRAQEYYYDECSKGPPTASELVEELSRATEVVDREYDELLEHIEYRLPALPNPP